MITFREVNISDAEKILKWRTSRKVTTFMNTDIENDLNAQEQWIKESYNKSHYYHWIIQYKNHPIGLINISDYSIKTNSTSWGFYIGDDNFNGLGAFIPPHLYNFLFHNLNVNTINAEVFYNNTSVIGLHLLHNYSFNPERDHVIVKNKKQILLVGMTLHKKDWLSSKLSRNNYHFPTEHWMAKPNHN